MRVLSIDGGGVRGILPARALVELERLGGKPISEQFDLIAATATGAILALGLCSPGVGVGPRYSAEDMLGFHVLEGPALVRGEGTGRWRSRLPGGERAHHRQDLSRSLRELLGEVSFGDALSHLIVPAFDVETARPVIFRSPEFSGRVTPLMREVGHATSAIPTRHAPVQIDLGGKQMSLAHGGFVATNPVLFAYAAARQLVASRGQHGVEEVGPQVAPSADAVGSRPDAPVASDEVVVVSLGVGRREPASSGYEEHHPLRGWSWPSSPLSALGAMFDGTAHAHDQTLTELLGASPGRRDRYWRIQGSLNGCAADMHAADRGHVECLREVAEEMVDRHARDLTDATAALST